LATTGLLTIGLCADCTAATSGVKKSSAVVSASNLPPLPAGVTELSFHDFFKLPAGPKGLEPTEKLLQLNGKKVRIIGYMAKDEEPTPGLFILSSLSVNVAEASDGPADDLPPARLFVHMPKEDADKTLAFRPGPWVLTGTLQLGNQEENNGRTSYARLLLDKKDADEALRGKTLSSARN
jgi:hypothetical protein